MAQEYDGKKAVAAEDEVDRLGHAEREALSALLDGEASDFELRSLLKNKGLDADLMAVWERYSLSRSALQGEPFRQASPGFSARVANAVANEPLPGEAGDRGQHVQRGWWPNAAKLAVAASVALAVFVGMQVTLNQGWGSRQMADVQPEAAPGMVDPEAQQRLNEYIQSVSINSRSDNALPDYNILRDSPLIRPVSDRELINPELINPELINQGRFSPAEQDSP